MTALHLVITTLCDRNCKFCCNKKYDIQNLQYASEEDFKSCDELYLTGGEPFTYTNPVELAHRYKRDYPNIKRVVIYTNAMELAEYLKLHDTVFGWFIDGVNVSIKNYRDLWAYILVIRKDERIKRLKFNRIYDFTGSIPMLKSDPDTVNHFELIKREWQTDFQPADNCIFRRGN